MTRKIGLIFGLLHCTIVSIAQNVGVKTNTPQATLDVNGKIKLADDNAMKYLITYLLCFVFASSFSQNVGIGTTTPQRSLHLNSGTFLITGDTGTAPTLGTGAKFLWVPAKSALRAGYTTSASGYWNHANIGQYSFTYGNQSNATGIAGFAGGNSAFANGDNSVALGTSINANADNATAIGRNLTANSFNSLVIGRYNETTGDNTTWVETDPLFAVGNGFVTTIGGLPVTTRRDAFKILKNGNTLINGSATISSNLSVNNNMTVNNSLLVANTLEVTGASSFNNTTTINNRMVISNGQRIDAYRTGGISQNLNLVPIGIVDVNLTYFRNAGLDNCTGAYTNLYGNLIVSETHDCSPGLSLLDGRIRIELNFNSLIANEYNQIIAVPSLTYSGNGTSGSTSFISIFSTVDVNATTQKAEKYACGWVSQSVPEVGDFYVRGTVMFYGLKN